MLKLIAILAAASLLTACDIAPKAGPKPHYQSTFPKTPAGCCLLDRLPHRPKHLAEGRANEGEIANADPNSGILTLEAPGTIEDDPVTKEPKTASVGLFRTGLNYGPGAKFSLRATFRRPEGPLNSLAWSVGVTARDGGLGDRYDAKRVSATLRIRKGGAMLNIGGGADPGDRDPAKDIGELYGSIFNGDQSQPFTLELQVDRTVGRGTVSLIKDGTVRHTLKFKLEDKLKDTRFTTVGATLADCCVPGAKMSAELKDFQVWQPRPPSP